MCLVSDPLQLWAIVLSSYMGKEIFLGHLGKQQNGAVLFSFLKYFLSDFKTYSLSHYTMYT